MASRALTLPIRALARPEIANYTCRRCLHSTASKAQELTTTPAAASPDASYDGSLPASQREYSLSKTDRLVKRILPHSVRPQLLQHVDPALLHGRERETVEKMHKHNAIVGVVVRTGTMDKTVSVRVAGRRWEPRIGKYFADHTSHLVHDPNSSLAQGDVVSLHRLRVSAAVHHVVAAIITPFGTPIADRPPIPTPEERLAAYKASRLDKLARRSLRREAAKGSAEAIAELRRLGLDPGAGAAPGKGELFGLEKGAGKARTPAQGALMGSKGQKLPKGVLPGGKHEVGKIDARAKHNKERALKMGEKAERNSERSRGLERELGEKGVQGDAGR